MKKVYLLLLLSLGVLNGQAQCNLLSNAIPGITLVHQNTNCFNNSGVAYNPNLGLYYGVRAGNSSFPLETWSATSTPLYQTSAGFDWRGMWWNPTTNQLEGNGYNTSGIWKADLNASGYALNTGTSIFTGMNQPDIQSCGDLDWQAYEILYYYNGLIYRYSRTTNALLGSYPITGTPVAISNLNSTTVMYTGCPGKEIALLDYVNKRVYVYNKANGAYAGMSQLPATAVTTGSFRTSWANCRVWLFNLADYTWYSYQIFDACSTCAPVYTNFSYSICNGDSLFLAGSWHHISGSFNDTLTAASGCDSILVNTLNVIPPALHNVAVSVCTGDSLFLGGAWRHTAGVYYDTLTAASGCDSVVISTLSITPLSFSTSNLSVCSGDSIFLGGAWRHTGGTFHDTLTASTGCDSIRTTNLTILPIHFSTQFKNICAGDSMLLAGSWQHFSGVYVDTLTTVAGCDSIRTTNLTVHPTPNSTQNKVICQGEQIFLGGAWQTTPGVYVDTFTAITGCDSIRTSILSVNPLPVVYLGRDTLLCEGDAVLLDATTPNVTYLWQDNSIGATLLATQSGTYWVEVTMNNCKDRDSIQVTFNPVPKVDLGPDQSLCPDRSVTLDVTTPNATYLWQDMSRKPTFMVSKNGTYWVKVQLANCTASDTVQIDFNQPDCKCPVFMPNAFSPNNDGKNDEFGLVNALGVDLKEFRVFNRWGEEVFRTTGLFDKWNGNHKGDPAPVGTYFYYVKYICRYSGKVFELKGDVTLLR